MRSIFAALSLCLCLHAQQGVDWVRQVRNKPFADVRLYNFRAQAPGGSLTGGQAATVTLTPCPLGLNGSDSAHMLYVSGGTGTAEAVTITGGTCTSGASSGTVAFTPTNSHSGAWTIKSASSGIKEAINSLPSQGGTLWMPVSGSPYVVYASLNFDRNLVWIGDQNTIIQASGAFPSSTLVSTAAGITVTIDGLVFDGNRAANPSAMAALVFANGTGTRMLINRCTFENVNAAAAVNFTTGVLDSKVTSSYFFNNVTHGIVVNPASLTLVRDVFTDNTFFYSNYAISSCTNATPIVCTLSAPASLINNQSIAIRGASVAAINNQWTITVVSSTQFSLNSSTAAGASTGGTLYEGNFSLSISNAQRWVYSNNVTYGGGEVVQIAPGSSYGVVSNNVMDTTTDAGVTCFGSGAGNCSFNNISNNVIVSPFYEGLYCGDYCVSNVWANNTIWGAGGGGITNRKSGITIFGSHTSGNIVTGGLITVAGEYGSLISQSAANTRISGVDDDGNISGPIHTDGTDTGTTYVPATGGTTYQYGCTGTLSSSASLFISVSPPGACTNTAEGVGQRQVQNKTGLLRNLIVKLGSNAVNNTPVTVRLDGVNTTLTCTVAAASSTCTDTTHSVATVPGNAITVLMTTGAAETASGALVAFDR